MSEKVAQATMQTVKVYMVAIRQLIEQPENPMHIDLLDECEFA